MASHFVDPYGATHGLNLLCMWPGKASFTLHEQFLAHLDSQVYSINFLSVLSTLTKKNSVAQ